MVQNINVCVNVSESRLVDLEERVPFSGLFWRPNCNFPLTDVADSGLYKTHTVAYCKYKYYLRTFGEFQTWKINALSMVAPWHITLQELFYIYFTADIHLYRTLVKM